MTLTASSRMKISMSRSSFSTVRHLPLGVLSLNSLLTFLALPFVTAAGQAMYERAAEDGSFGSESKSNENEAEYASLLEPPSMTSARLTLSAFLQHRPEIRRHSGRSRCSLRELLDWHPDTVTVAQISASVPPTSISIISPYNSQVVLIASSVHPQYPEIEVNSVDSCQGRENGEFVRDALRSIRVARPFSG